MTGGGGCELELKRILAMRLVSEEKTDEVEAVMPPRLDDFRSRLTELSLLADLARAPGSPTTTYDDEDGVHPLFIMLLP